MPQTPLFCPLFSPQSQLTNRFRLMFSTAEVCNIWEHKLSVYKWRAVRHTILIQSDTILRRSLKGFSKQQPSQHCLWKRALLHWNTTMYRNVLIQNRFFSESTNTTLIQVLLNKTSFFTFQLDSNWPKCSIHNLYWCTLLKHLIPSPVECSAGNVSVLSNMPGWRWGQQQDLHHYCTSWLFLMLTFCLRLNQWNNLPALGTSFKLPFNHLSDTPRRVWVIQINQCLNFTKWVYWFIFFLLFPQRNRTGDRLARSGIEDLYLNWTNSEMSLFLSKDNDSF